MMTRPQRLIALLVLMSSAVFSACAFDLAHVRYDPAVMTKCTEECPLFVVKEELPLSGLPCGYKRTLKKDSEWIMVGKIEAGDVYKPLNQCFTIECSNVFEAYLVLEGNMLNGFYLPVDKGYVSLKTPTKIPKK